MNLEYTKSDDLIGTVTNLAVDLAPFLGEWKNTKSNSGQLPKVLLEEINNELYLHAYGADENGLKDWGTVKCNVYTDGVNSATANAFITKFTFENIDVEISANVKQGVLVIQTYTIFRDLSKRYNYYTREFYGPLNPKKK